MINKKYFRTCPRCNENHYTTSKVPEAICKGCKMKSGGSHIPITLGGHFKSEWEDIMACLDKSTHKHAHIVKYKLQCRIDVAIDREEWR